MENLNKALEPVLNELQKLHQGFIEVNRRFDKIDQRFDGIDERFDTVDRRFSAIDDDIHKLNHEVRGLGLKMDQMRSDHRALKEVVLEMRDEKLPDRILAIEEEQERHDIRLTAVERRRF